MLLRFSLSAAGALLLAAGAQAQSNASFLPVPGVKHAGTYNMATGKLVKGESVTKGDMEVLYANNCSPGVYSNGITANGLPSRYHDAGQLPGTNSPTIVQDNTSGSNNYMNVQFTGTNDSYLINQYHIAYCTQTITAPGSTWEINFWDLYDECTDITTTPVPTAATHLLINLPGTPTVGVGACWGVTVNLFNSTFAFTMVAEGDGTWHGSASLDTFGISVGQFQGHPSIIWTSPILEGDPEGILGDGPGGTGCAIGVTTVFWEGSYWPGTASQGSGLAAYDRFAKAEWNGASWQHNGCYWFGGYHNGNHMGNVHMVMWGYADADIDTGTPYGGGGSGMPCPCANNNDGSLLPALSGCAGTPNPGGCALTGTGNPSISSDTVVLYATNAKPTTNGLFFKGDTQLLPGVPMGGTNANGLLQAVTKIKRFPALPVSGGACDTTGYGNPLSVISNATAGAQRNYQFWYRSPKASGPCSNPSPGGSNTSNGFQVIWMP